MNDWSLHSLLTKLRLLWEYQMAFSLTTACNSKWKFKSLLSTSGPTSKDAVVFGLNHLPPIPKNGKISKNSSFWGLDPRKQSYWVSFTLVIGFCETWTLENLLKARNALFSKKISYTQPLAYDFRCSQTMEAQVKNFWFNPLKYNRKNMY